MKCPLLNKACIKEKCAWWATCTKRVGPGQEVRVEYACLVTQIPSMLIELIKNTGGVAAATEQVRNRMEHVAKNTETQVKIFAGMAELAVNGNGRKALADPEGK